MFLRNDLVQIMLFYHCEKLKVIHWCNTASSNMASRLVATRRTMEPLFGALPIWEIRDYEY